jgi:hypothetical protein
VYATVKVPTADVVTLRAVGGAGGPAVPTEAMDALKSAVLEPAAVSAITLAWYTEPVGTTIVQLVLVPESTDEQ